MSMMWGATVAVVTVNDVDDVAVPPSVVTVIVPVVAPLGTDVVMCASSATVNAAVVPLNLTELAPVNPVPVIVTSVATGPLGGVNPAMVGVGDGFTVKDVVDVPVPLGPVTEMVPVAAPLGTDVLMCWLSVTL